MGVFDGTDELGKVDLDVHVDLADRRSDPSAALQRPAAPGRSAGSPILDAGQLLIAGMRITTGWGEPVQGEPFIQGATHFAGAGETVGAAYPGEDWRGSGAEAYTDANRRHAGRTASLAVLDRSVQSVIAREAQQVAYRRGKLDEQSDYLGDLSYTTGAIGLIPGMGMAMKSAVELAAVSAALSVSSGELDQLSNEVGENTARLHELAGEYSTSTPESLLPPGLEDEPAQPPSDDAPVPAPTDLPAQPAPPRDTMASVAPPPAPVTAEPAQAHTASAMPEEAMSPMASAFGAVGGVIGAVVAPLTAVLTGAAAAAGQSLSSLTSSGVGETGADTGAPISDRGVERPSGDESDDDADDDAAGETAAEGGVVPPGIVAESDGAPPDGLAPPPPPPPAPPPAPPAATRPPR